MNNPITVIITVVSPPRGRGPSEQKKDFKQYFGRNGKQLLPSDNNNKLCLFYALELARIYHDSKMINQKKKKGEPIPKYLVTSWSFTRIMNEDMRKNKIAWRLLNEIGIDPKLDSYGLDVLPIVQDFYDREYPGFFNIPTLMHNKNFRIVSNCRCRRICKCNLEGPYG